MVKISCSVSKPQWLKVERCGAIRPKIALLDPCKNYGRGRRDLWVHDSSCTYERTCGIHLMGGLAADAERRVPGKRKEKTQQ